MFYPHLAHAVPYASFNWPNWRGKGIPKLILDSQLALLKNSIEAGILWSGKGMYQNYKLYQNSIFARNFSISIFARNFSIPGVLDRSELFPALLQYSNTHEFAN